jgi:two-component system LytT family response regulator
VQKVTHRYQRTITQQLELLLSKLNPSSPPINKVAMPTMEGLQMIAIDSIISCESDSNYTIVMIKGKQKLKVSRTLKEIEEMLEGYLFARVHHSYLVNLNEINKYVKGEGGYLQMSDSSTIDVSRSRKDALMKKLLRGR